MSILARYPMEDDLRKQIISIATTQACLKLLGQDTDVMVSEKAIYLVENPMGTDEKTCANGRTWAKMELN